MISPAQATFFQQMYEAAKAANHKWPKAAACEAIVETGWGAHMPPHSLNVLGIKWYADCGFPSVASDGTEQAKNGTWTGPQHDLWMMFPTYAACFAQQMHILTTDHRYAFAMTCTDERSYIATECRVWSTGILKGLSVLNVYANHAKDLR